MNPEQYSLLLQLLELPDGATDSDVIDTVRDMRRALTAVGGNEMTEEARAGVLAATSRLTTLTGSPTLGGAVNVVEQRFALLADHEKTIERERKLVADLQRADYRELTGELVKLGAEIPATAWQDERGTVPVQRLLDEPLPALRDRVERLRAAVGDTQLVPMRDGIELSPRQLAMCEAKGVDPKAFEKIKKGIAAKSAAREN